MMLACDAVACVARDRQLGMKRLSLVIMLHRRGQAWCQGPWSFPRSHLAECYLAKVWSVSSSQ